MASCRSRWPPSPNWTRRLPRRRMTPMPSTTSISAKNPTYSGETSRACAVMAFPLLRKKRLWRQARGFGQAEHEVEVLHHGARSALAEIVEQGHQPRLPRRVRAEDVELHAVGAVEPFRLERLERSRLFKRRHFDEALARRSEE